MLKPETIVGAGVRSSRITPSLHQLHHIPGLQGRVLPGHELLRIQLDCLTIANDENMARVAVAGVDRRQDRLGHRQILRPRDVWITHRSDNRNDSPSGLLKLLLLHSNHRLLLPGKKSGLCVGFRFGLGHATDQK